MRLSQLFPNKDLPTDPDVMCLCEDSRTARADAVFFAHVGSKDNGLKYIDDAIMAGCVAIVVPENVTVAVNEKNIPILFVQNTRAEISRCSALLYPRQPKNIVAVTGTSGKTSTAFFVQQFLNLSGCSAVSVGTIGVAGAMTREGSLTTPEAPELHALLQEISDQNIGHVAMEASSQALDQYRMDHVVLRAAAFLNLSHDHLDYHGTSENYRSAKSRLFADILTSDGVAVLNADDDHFKTFSGLARARKQTVLSYGVKGHDLTLLHSVLTSTGQDLTVRYQGKEYKVNLSIAGSFQSGNILAAMGLCLALGTPFEKLVTLAPRLIAPPGRLQNVPGHPAGTAIYVDYAHKPDALENVLLALRAHTPQNLICVFGCGGDRDTSKREVMGAIAARLATHVIVTDDNPRSENPDKIRAAILSACPGAQDIGDRRAAIRAAITMAGPHDIVVIAGKGHEQGQKFATHTEPFDDVAECAAAIRDLSRSPSPLAVNGQ